MNNLVLKSEQQIARRDEPTVLEVIQTLAVDDRVSVEKLAGLLALQERAEARNAEREFNTAFAAMQLEMPRVPKRGVKDMQGKGRIPYARWEDLDALVRPVLARHGFSLSFPTRMIDGKMVMVLVLSHIGGHAKESFMPVSADPGPGRNDIQAVGSGRSYTKRYLTLDALNIVCDGADDDGAATGFITDQQADTIMCLLDECGAKGDPGVQSAFLRYMAAKTVSEIQAHDFRKAITALENKRRHAK